MCCIHQAAVEDAQAHGRINAQSILLKLTIKKLAAIANSSGS